MEQSIREEKRGKLWRERESRVWIHMPVHELNEGEAKESCAWKSNGITLYVKNTWFCLHVYYVIFISNLTEQKTLQLFFNTVIFHLIFVIRKNYTKPYWGFIKFIPIFCLLLHQSLNYLKNITLTLTHYTNLLIIKNK